MDIGYNSSAEILSTLVTIALFSSIIILFLLLIPMLWWLTNTWLAGKSSVKLLLGEDKSHLKQGTYIRMFETTQILG